MPARAVLFDAAEVDTSFDYVLLAVQPPQVRAAVESVAHKLADHARVVCFQNGLCEDLVAEVVGAERVIGGVVAWGASMSGPGRYDRTASGGFTLGRLGGGRDAPLECPPKRRAIIAVEPTGPPWFRAMLGAYEEQGDNACAIGGGAAPRRACDGSGTGRDPSPWAGGRPRRPRRGRGG